MFWRQDFLRRLQERGSQERGDLQGGPFVVVVAFRIADLQRCRGFFQTKPQKRLWFIAIHYQNPPYESGTRSAVCMQ
jgi:hypothetical protein